MEIPATARRRRRKRKRKIADDAGILEFNTWRYYVRNFGCSHFKGRDIEDNYYLLRPLYLLDGKPVNLRKRFHQFLEEKELLFCRDYVLSGGQQLAIAAAKFLYQPDFVEPMDIELFRLYYAIN
jgi:hypothetical protein